MKWTFLLLPAFTLGAPALLANPAAEAPQQASATRVAELSQTVQEVVQQLKEHEKRISSLEATREKTKRLHEVADELQRELQKLRHEVTRKNDELAQYRERYQDHVRYQAIGEEYKTFVTTSGRRFRDVSIRKVTDTGLEIRHANGSARILPEEAPLDLRKRFQWNSDVVAAILEAEKEREVLRDQVLQVRVRQETLAKRASARAQEVDARLERLESSAAAAQLPVSISSNLDGSPGSSLGPLNSSSENVGALGRLGERKPFNGGRSIWRRPYGRTVYSRVYSSPYRCYVRRR